MMTTLTPQGFFRTVDRSLERFMGQVFDGLVAPGRAETFAPALDLHETPEAYRVEVDLPGVKEDDVNVSVEDGVLSISAERKSVERAEGDEARHVERRHAHYLRKLRLPNQIDAERIEGTLAGGVLTLTIPKAKEATPRRIQIKRAE